ncbi:MAG: hypothetical protein IKK57_02205 [Clostridia bacterium]|nr:hypothetical protein [Clostridia bacterium]
MQEKNIRQAIHNGVDAYAASVRENPFLARHVIALAERKEQPRMKKKLSTAAIVLLAFLLASLTAAAIGLTVRDVWRQSFDKMNTSGYIQTISDETTAELPMEEAIAIARAAIIAKYGTPESELDAMGVYPGYFARGWDGDCFEDPSEWDVLFSSRTNVDLDLDHLDYGPTGEYRVFINAETKEVTYCHWYTNDFWSRAQTVWDCGSHDEVWWWYCQPTFRALPIETQRYWEQTLADAGYDVVNADEKLHKLLLGANTDLKFLPLTAFADDSLPQVAAAWAEMERMGFDVELLRRYCYVATIPDWELGTGNVCIHYSFEKEFAMEEAGFLDPYSANLFSWADSFGLYMFSFEPGTTNITAVTHVTRAESIREEPVTEGSLLDRNIWHPTDLAAFDAAFQRLDMGVKRMRAAGVDLETMHVIVNDYLHALGCHEIYRAAPEGIDVDVWFADESEWDALVTTPRMTFDEYCALYGVDDRFWPMEVLCELDPRGFRMPNPGETTLEEAKQLGVEAVITAEGKEMRARLADYEVFVRRVSLTSDPEAVDCRWEVYLVRDYEHPIDGFRVTWGEWEDRTDEPHVQDINDLGNG